MPFKKRSRDYSSHYEDSSFCCVLFNIIFPPVPAPKPVSKPTVNYTVAEAFITDSSAIINSSLKDALRPSVGAQAHLTASLENSNSTFEFFNEVNDNIAKSSLNLEYIPNAVDIETDKLYFNINTYGYPIHKHKLYELFLNPKYNINFANKQGFTIIDETINRSLYNEFIVFIKHPDITMDTVYHTLNYLYKCMIKMPKNKTRLLMIELIKQIYNI